jgi:hypothetical protein
VKKLLVIGGPIGAGKTTAAHRMLPEALNIRGFLHADAIARGLWPLNPEGKAVAAGREMIRRIRGLALSGANFAFETTCAGRSRLRSATDLGRSGSGDPMGQLHNEGSSLASPIKAHAATPIGSRVIHIPQQRPENAACN